METVAIVTWLVSAAKFLKDTGADGAVKEGAKSVFSWLKTKFTKKSEQDKITTVEDSPDNEAAIKALEQMIADTQKDDAVLIASLQEQVDKFEKVVSEKMPTAAKQINNNITNSKNVVTGKISNIHTGGGDFHIGDRT